LTLVFILCLLGVIKLFVLLFYSTSSDGEKLALDQSFKDELFTLIVRLMLIFFINYPITVSDVQLL